MISVSSICVEARLVFPVAVKAVVRTAMRVVTITVKAMIPGGRMSSMATIRIALQPRGSRSAELTIDRHWHEPFRVVLSFFSLLCWCQRLWFSRGALAPRQRGP